MKHLIIPFTVKPESLEVAKSAISSFIANIRKNEPGTLVYKSFQQTDEPTKFIHVMTFANEAAEETHRKTAYCKEFVDQLYPLCSELPNAKSYYEIS